MSAIKTILKCVVSANAGRKDCSRADYNALALDLGDDWELRFGKTAIRLLGPKGKEIDRIDVTRETDSHVMSAIRVLTIWNRRGETGKFTGVTATTPQQWVFCNQSMNLYHATQQRERSLHLAETHESSLCFDRAAAYAAA